MLTMEKVLDMFKDYLAADDEIEIASTSRGLIRMIWAGKRPYCDEAYVCATPEELFDTLLADFQTYTELKLTRGQRELTPEDHDKVQAMSQPYLEKREMEELL